MNNQQETPRSEENDLETLATRLSLALVAGKVGVWDWNIESNVTIWDDRMFEIYGIPKIVPMPYDNWINAVYPEDRADAEAAVKEAILTKTRNTGIFRIIKPDSTIRYIESSADAICDDSGKVIRVIGINIDITEKRVSRQTQVSYNLLHKLIENIPGAVYQYILYPDGSSSFPYLSKGVENIFGVSIQDAMQDRNLIFGLIHQDDLNIVETSIKESAVTMKEWNVKYRVDLPIKGLLWLHVKSTPEKLGDGSVLWNGVIHDITKEKRLEEEQQQLFEQLEEAQSIAKIGSWSFDINNNVLTWSNENYRIFGVDKEETLNYEKFVSFLYPEDIKSFEQEWENALNGGEYSFVHRIIVDHEVKWLDQKAKIKFDKEGKPLKAIGTTQDITEQKEAENLLKKNEEMLSLIIDKSPVGICTVDLLGNFVSTNPTYEKMIGYSKKELSKLSFFDITHPDYRPKNKELFQKMFSLEASGFSFEKIYICKDGKEIDVSVHATGISDEAGNIQFGTAFVEDVTVKKYALEQLEQKKNELERIITNAPSPMILHEEGGKILMYNQAWVDSSGFSFEEIPTISDWIENTRDDEETIIFMKNHIDSLYEITEVINEGEFTFLNKSRDLVTWQVSSSPLGLIDGKRTIITSAMDITELKHKDEMLINQSRHAAMGEMIGMIAHQWRQPLSVISMDANNMLMDIALEDFNATQAKEYANSISAQTQHLSKTIDDFRNFFKPDKVISEVNIRETIDKTLSIVKDSLKNNSIELTSSIETEETVKAYPRELMQVFVNIITNSKDALAHNKQDNALISIRVYEDEKYINTKICDNGGGIDIDILPKIFDPYFSTKDEKTGTGLGLYMSRMIIEEHLNGIIEVDNKDEGACFTIKLLK